MQIVKSPIGDRLDQYARERGLTYQAIALGTGVTPPYITQVANGKKPPSKKFLESCVSFFGLCGSNADEFRYLGEISQDNIIIKPANFEEAMLAVAFKRELAASRSKERGK